MRMWLLGGLVAIGAAGVVACGGPETGEDLGTVVSAHKNEDRNKCSEEDRERFCELIEADQNITQVFVDLPGCFDLRDVEKVVAFDKDNDVVRVYSGNELKENGGPCNEIERDFWFPLQGNQDEAKICVFFEDDVRKVPKDVAISFKAGGECFEDDEVDDRDCKACERKDDDCKDKDGRREEDCKDHDGHGGRDHDNSYRWDEGRSIKGWEKKDQYHQR